MTQTEKRRNALIGKIQLIQDDGLLQVLDNLVSNVKTDEIVQLTSIQEELLQMSEDDINAGRIVNESELIKMDQEWLEGK